LVADTQLRFASQVLRSVPPAYKIKDFEGKKIQGKFFLQGDLVEQVSRRCKLQQYICT
jgi:hypothetical protein